MTTTPLADFRDHLSEHVSDVERTHARVEITRHGRTAAVLISPEELAALEETLEVLSTPGSASAIQEGLADLAAGRIADSASVRRRFGVVQPGTALDIVTPDAVRAQLATDPGTGQVRFELPEETSSRDRRTVQKRLQQIAYANGFAGNYRTPYDGNVLLGYAADPTRPRTPQGRSVAPEPSKMSPPRRDGRRAARPDAGDEKRGTGQGRSDGG